MIYMPENNNFQEDAFPADLTSPKGMQVIFGTAHDDYSAFYTPNVEYAGYGDRTLRLQVISPSGDGPFPLIVYIQGSAWFTQNLYMNIPQLSNLAHRGFVVASVEYRSSHEAKFPAQLRDVKAAIRFLRANHEKYKIDSNRVAVWGDSSGGHLAAMVGVTAGVSEFDTEDNLQYSSEVKAVVDFYGPTDILQMSKHPSVMDHDSAESPESCLIGGAIQENVDKAQATNPINYISENKKLPPFLIMHGDKDPLVPFNQSVLLYEALKEAKQQVTFYKVKGAGHGVGFWTKETLDIVYKFLSAYV
jgi:acetyl esterase/lipase